MNIRSSAFRLLAAAVLALAAALPCTALAVGTEFTWQGELRESGQPANGSYDFEFRLYAAATGGSPIGPLRTLSAQSITTGIYTTLLDFGDQFTGEPRWLEISVRRSGQPTFTTLLPRHALTATPYAQHADFVADNSIIGANILDGSIGSVDLAIGAVSSTQIANGGVSTIDLADGSVTTPKLADASVTAAKIAPGAIGAAQIDSATVQARVSARCPEGLPLLGMDAAGGVSCDDAQHQMLSEDLTVIDFALVNDVPFAVAIRANGSLISLRCETGECSDGASLGNTLDTSVGSGAQAVSVVVNDLDRPVIAYQDRSSATSVGLIVCRDEACLANDPVRFVDVSTASGVNPGTRISSALRNNGLPVFVWLVDNGGNGVLRLYDCADAACAAGTLRTLDTASVDRFVRPALAIASGDRPVVYYAGGGSIKQYACANAQCAAGTVSVVHNQAPTTLAAVIRPGDRPLVSFSTGTPTSTRLLDVVPATVTTLASPASGGTAMAMDADGIVSIAYGFNSRLEVQSCVTASCASFMRRTLTGATFGNGSEVDMQVRTDRRPVLLHDYAPVFGFSFRRISVCGNTGCRP